MSVVPSDQRRCSRFVAIVVFDWRGLEECARARFVRFVVIVVFDWGALEECAKVRCVRFVAIVGFDWRALHMEECARAVERLD